MKLTARGIKETIENLRNTDQKLSKMDNAMRQVTALVAGAAKRNAPVDRGHTRASITPSVMSSGSTIKGVVGSNLISAVVMELGTKPFWPPVSALETWARRHGMVAFLVARAISRRGLKARRFLQRAFDDNRRRIIQIFNSEVNRIIK